MTTDNLLMKTVVALRALAKERPSRILNLAKTGTD